MGGKVNRQADGFSRETPAFRDFAWRVMADEDARRMISFAGALERLLGETDLLPTERVPLERAHGRVLRQALESDRPLPPFDRVMMDGFALRVADWEAGTREFRVTDSAPAGKPRVAFGGGPGTCVEVMTGAPCPVGADGIVPVEEVLSVKGGVVVFKESAAPVAGRFIHVAGSDVAAGEVVLEPGRVIGSREIGVAASCGVAVLEVSRLPRIGILATGDELVPVDQTPEPHQIRQSNAHALSAALMRAGYPVAHAGVLTDDPDLARPVVAGLLESCDWLLFTGAVSRGARDFVPALLDELGARKIFHGVSQRPGKPAGCWRMPGGGVIMALPGNPVSALTGLHAFVLPALAKACGLKSKSPRLVIPADESAGLPDFTWHMPVVLRGDGRAEAAPTGNSGDFIGLLKSDGFLTLPPRNSGTARAAAFSYTPWL